MVPKVSIEDGIESVRYMFPRMRIDSINADIGVRALREYQRLFDEKLGVFKKSPLENWAIHIADAFRYLAVQYRRLYDVPGQTSTYNTGNM